jgi:DNA polymerase V
VLPLATSHTPTLIKAALSGLKRIYKPGYHYRKLGVLFWEILPESQVQLDMFSPLPLEKDAALMKALDQINAVQGSHALFFAGEGIKQPWRMRQQKLSPRYTTSWKELPIARA